jgi:nucleotide-binding universal stress UspA family protein
MTGRLTRILAATDGGPSGRLAVVRAASIARETGAVLHAVHVVDPDDDSTEVATPVDRDLAKAELRHHLARINPPPELHVRHGPTFVEIVHLAQSLDVDLIVAGAHRRPDVRQFFIGTTAGRLTRLGDRPLLLVRHRVQGPYRRVIVGVDASAASAHVISTAQAVAPTATIIPAMVFQVVGESKLRSVAGGTAIAELRAEVARQREQELAEFLATHAPDSEAHEPLLEIGDPRERLPQLPREQHCDLIAVGTHGKTGIRYALLGSVAEHVLRDTDRDVLLARRSRSPLDPT